MGCGTKSQPISVETHARGLKRKLFNPVGGVVKAGRMGTICVGRLDEDTASGEQEDGMYSSGAAGGECEVLDQTGSVEMPSQADDEDEMPIGMECSGALSLGSREQSVEMASQGS